MITAAAQAVLALHILVVVFNLFGLIAVPLGAWRRWSFVHRFWWRALHIASMGAVAVQALIGRACFLTIWENRLKGRSGQPTPMIQELIESALYWDFPPWAFAAGYSVLFAYTLALWRLVPPRRQERHASR